MVRCCAPSLPPPRRPSFSSRFGARIPRLERRATYESHGSQTDAAHAGAALLPKRRPGTPRPRAPAAAEQGLCASIFRQDPRWWGVIAAGGARDAMAFAPAVGCPFPPSLGRSSSSSPSAEVPWSWAAVNPNLCPALLPCRSRGGARETRGGAGECISGSIQFLVAARGRQRAVVSSNPPHPWRAGRSTPSRACGNTAAAASSSPTAVLLELGEEGHERRRC
jgi:hypothetical protein